MDEKGTLANDVYHRSELLAKQFAPRRGCITLRCEKTEAGSRYAVHSLRRREAAKELKQGV